MRTLPAFVAALGAAFAATAALGQSIKLEVLSSRPELVTGHTALVRITGTPVQPPAYASNDTLIAPMHDDGHGGWIGIIPELNEAENKLFALPNFRSPGPEVEVRVQSHAVNDTLFAGPQVTPFRCENQAHGLAPPADAGCTVPPVVEYTYRSTAGGWRAMNPALAAPADTAMTMTSDGRTVPLIVRVEKGVANRSAYAIAVLHDPAKASPVPWNKTGLGWNGRLIFAVGGGVGYDGHAMGTAIGFFDPKAGYVGGENDGLYESLIDAGYAIAGASLIAGGVTGNDIVQAETVAKVKEQFVKRYGPPQFTVGIGKDGGVAPLTLIAQNYPGLFDGIFAINGYADGLQLQTATNDCALLRRTFATTKVAWSEAEKRTAGGLATLCAAAAPAADVPCAPGDACTLAENLATVFGRDPQTGLARSPWDNAGIQYGLVPFKLGLISEAQFLDLNAAIGGRTAAGGFQRRRNEGDAAAIRAAYATGRIATGDGLASTAIVGVRLYPVGTCAIAPCPPDGPLPAPGAGDRSMALRTRLELATASRGNLSELTIEDYPAIEGPDGAIAKVMAGALRNLDKWLSDVVADTSDATRAGKIVTHRPPALRDTTCIAQGAIFTDAKTCDSLVPAAPGARVAAGAPVTDDVLKCALKPLDPADYPATVSADLIPRLRQIFPDGVCDFSKPGIGQVPLAGTWLAYTANGKFAVSALP